tara:strand:- start:6376 stop:6783 length:408 start_codon:yes stop_codon:yes gene_type:complete
MLLLLGCGAAKSSVKPTDPGFTVTADAYDLCVNPKDSHYVAQFKTKVFRHENCGGVDDLLAVAWSSPELTNDAINGASMLAIGYAGHLNRMPSTDTKYFVRYLNTIEVPYRGKSAYVAFFSIESRAQSVNKKKQL